MCVLYVCISNTKTYKYTNYLIFFNLFVQATTNALFPSRSLMEGLYPLTYIQLYICNVVWTPLNSKCSMAGGAWWPEASG